MSYKKYFLVLIFTCFAFLISASPVHSSDDEDARLSLKGLQGIFVLIGELPPEFKEAGLTEYQVQTDVELKVLMAGIKLLSGEAKVPGDPFLYVRIEGGKVKKPPNAVSVLFAIELQQKVCLFRDPKYFLWTPTWSSTKWGLVPETGFTERVRETVKDTIDIFINAYLSVNPKGGK